MTRLRRWWTALADLWALLRVNAIARQLEHTARQQAKARGTVYPFSREADE